MKSLEYNIPDAKYSVTIKESRVFNHILEYGATFDTITHYSSHGSFTVTSIENDEGKLVNNYKLKKLLPFGITNLNYKDKEILIDYKHYLHPVGTHTTADCYELLILGGESEEIILEFIEEARAYCNPIKPVIKEETVSTYLFTDSKWKFLSKLKKRKLDSIFLPEDIKDNIINDIDKFVNSEEVYNQCGIPYQRNYLLYGIPGTGKTSLIFSIASKYDMDIAIFSFGYNIDDGLFMSAIARMPNNCILILEDIDGLFTERKSGDSNRSCVSFSGMLNTLDGVGRKHQLITFMTTNHIELLDPAILRPGRVDYKIYFDYVTEFQIKQMCEYLLVNKSNIDKFVKYAKNKQIPAALLQKFLFENRDTDNIMSHKDIFESIIEDYTSNNKKINLYT